MTKDLTSLEKSTLHDEMMAFYLLFFKFDFSSVKV
jgi:hypothetical protein